jgi:hypothetical protein
MCILRNLFEGVDWIQLARNILWKLGFVNIVINVCLE